MPQPRPEASGLAELVARAERRYRVAPLLMTGAAAAEIGISPMTLVRWRRDKRLLPHSEIHRGNQAPIPLYSPQEIAIGQALQGTIKPGPTPVKKRATPPRKVRIFHADKASRGAAQADRSASR